MGKPKYPPSILTDDLEHCYVCKKEGFIRNTDHIHHIFMGYRNREISTKYGCVCGLCYEHHEGFYGVHQNKNLRIGLEQECQKAFEKKYSHEAFMQMFGRSYL